MSECRSESDEWSAVSSSLLSSGTGVGDLGLLRECVFVFCFLFTGLFEASLDSSDVLSSVCLDADRRLRRERLLDFIFLDFLFDALERKFSVSSWILPIILYNNALVDGNLSASLFN